MFRLPLPPRAAALALALVVLLAAVPVIPAAAAPATQPAAPVYLPFVSRNGSPSLDIVVTPDNARAVSAVIPPQGGSLIATAANGAQFTLTIPADTLAVTTTVTLTPAAGIAGLPSPQLFAAVEIAPADAVLFEVATLRLDLPAKPPVAQELGFGWLPGGSDYHRTPILPDRPEIVFPVTAFHGYGLARRTTAGATVATAGAESAPPATTDAVNASDPRAQLAQQMADLIHAERVRQQSGLPPDPEFGTNVEALLRQFYTEVVFPTLARMRVDCAYAKANIGFALSWARQAALFAGEDAFAAETQAIFAAVVAALENCLAEATQPCMDWGDPEQAPEVFSLLRQLALLGAEHSMDEFAECQSVDVVLNGQQLRSFTLSQDAEDGWNTRAHFYFTDDTVSGVSFYNPFRPFIDAAKATVVVRAKIGGAWQTDLYGGNFFCRDQKARRVEELIVSISDVSGDPPKFTPQLVADNVGCWKWQGTSSWTVEHTFPNIDWSESGSVELAYERKQDLLGYSWNSAENKLNVGAMPYRILPEGKIDYQMDYTAYVDGNVFCSTSITVNRTQVEMWNSNSDHLRINNANLPDPGRLIHGVDDILINQPYEGDCGAFDTLELLPHYYSPGGTGNELSVSANGKSIQGQENGLLGEGTGTWTRMWNYVALREN